MRSVEIEGGGCVAVEEAVLGQGAEAEVFATSDGRVLKRFRDAGHGSRRLVTARRLLNLPADVASHGTLAPIVLPEAVVADAWGRPAFLMPRVPSTAVEAMKLVLPKSYRRLPRAAQGDLASRMKVAARLAAAIDGFRLLTGGHLTDGGLRNCLVDGAAGELWLIDIESAWFPDAVDGPTVSPLFTSPELERGQPPSHESDAFLIGICLHLLLLGHHPHPDSDPDPLSLEPDSLGQLTSGLLRAAVDREKPGYRPSGMLWAHQLTWLADRLIPCRDAACGWRAFPWTRGATACPACGTGTKTLKKALLVQWTNSAGLDVMGEAAVLGESPVELFERHVSAEPATLGGPCIGRLRRRRFSGKPVLEVDGKRPIEVVPNQELLVGDRRARVVDLAAA